MAEAEDDEAKQKAQEEYEKKIKEKEEFIKVLMSERRERRSSDERRQNGGGFSSSYNNNRRGGRGRYNRGSTGSFDRSEERDELKIFVGSLSWGVDDMMLGETFAREGFEVTSARVVMDRDDPTRSKRYLRIRCVLQMSKMYARHWKRWKVSCLTDVRFVWTWQPRDVEEEEDGWW